MSGPLQDPNRLATEDLRKAAEMPIELDVEDLRNEPAKEGNGDSPTKRTRWDLQPLQAPGSSVVPITLEQLTAQLAAAIAPVTGGMRELQNRITSMENEVTNKVGSALELIQTLDQRQKAMGQQLEEVKSKVQ